ncbi:hypothetical protein ABIE67_009123 [Streptomyces sp. V4I8]
MITVRHENALTTLDTAPINPAAKDALGRLSDSAVGRNA